MRWCVCVVWVRWWCQVLNFFFRVNTVVGKTLVYAEKDSKLTKKYLTTAKTELQWACDKMPNASSTWTSRCGKSMMVWQQHVSIWRMCYLIYSFIFIFRFFLNWKRHWTKTIAAVYKYIHGFVCRNVEKSTQHNNENISYCKCRLDSSRRSCACAAACASQQDEQQQQLHNYVFVERYYCALVVQNLNKFRFFFFLIFCLKHQLQKIL